MPQPRRPRRLRRLRRPRRLRRRQPGSEVRRQQLSRQRGAGEPPGRLVTTTVARVRCGTGRRASPGHERSPAGLKSGSHPRWRHRPATTSPYQCGFSVGSGPPHLRARPGLQPRTRRHAVRLRAPTTEELPLFASRQPAGMDWRVFAVAFVVVLGLQLRSLSNRGVLGVIFGDGAAASFWQRHFG